MSNLSKTSVNRLIVVDSRVTDWNSLIGDVNQDTTLLVLDSARDGLTQLAEAVGNTSNLNSIDIFSHGSSGSLLLGSTTLNNSNLEIYQTQLATIGNALSADGDILLYGCNVAQGETGLNFINQLSALTDADVAASDDLTGQGGDWLLELATGQIETSLVVNETDQAQYTGTLSTTYVGGGNGVDANRASSTEFDTITEGSTDDTITNLLYVYKDRDGTGSVESFKWGGGIGSGVSLSVSYSRVDSTYSQPYSDSRNIGVENFSDLQIDGARGALAAWAAVANISFTETIDSATNAGDIRWGQTNNPVVETGGGAPPGWYPLLGVSPISGDIWFGPNNSNAYGNPVVGTYGYGTYIHELGHSLGLGHPHDGVVPAESGEDQLKYSIMSYRDFAGDNTDSWGSSYFPTTPMLNDILAIQFLYGANTSYNTGDDNYHWDVGEKVYETIWDTGGIDTIDASIQDQGCLLNLNSGQWCQIGKAFSNGQTNVRDCLTIAYDTIIENATGSAFADTLIGNSANNILRGSGGNDTIDGGIGTDTAVYGAWANYTVTGNSTSATISDSTGTDGTDTLTSIEYLTFNGVTVTTEAAVNDAPVGVSDNNASDAVIEAGSGVVGDSSAIGNVLSNDTDADSALGLGETKTVNTVNNQNTNVGGVVAGLYGSLVLLADGNYTYTLDNTKTATNALSTGQVVVDTFTYTLVDAHGASSAPTTLSINITGSNDAPVNTAPVANPDVLNATEDSPIMTAYFSSYLLANDTDAEGNPLTISSVTSGTNGTAVLSTDHKMFTFTPNENFNGVANFTYQASDGLLNSNSATVTVNVAAVNDAPSFITDTVIFSDNFDADSFALNQTSFVGGWTVSNGSVDLVGVPGYDNLPGNGKYVDLDGNSGQAGIFAKSLSLTAGTTYTAHFQLAGSHRGANADTVDVTFGTASASYTLAASDPLTTYSVTFTPASSGNYSLNFHNQGGDNIGAILDNVSVSNTNSASTDTVSYIENGAAVVLNPAINVSDIELDAANNYNGASVTLVRQGGANAQDVFTGSGTLTLSNGAVVLDSTSVGSYTQANGELVISFNNNATSANVDNVLQKIAYSNSSDTPPTSVQINWTFNDGNTGAQGLGGALTALSSTVVNITAVNDAPEGTDKTVTINQGSSYIVTAADFGFSDPNDSPANAFLNVIVSSLPVTTDGVYKLDGVDVAVGLSIRVTDINAGKLVFIPATEKNGIDLGGLGFQVQDDGGTANGGVDTDATANTLNFNITAVSLNHAPVLDTPATINYTDTAFVDDFATVAGSLFASDVDAGTVFTYGIVGGTTGSIADTVVAHNAYGELTVNTVTGAYHFDPNNAAIEPLIANTSDSFTVTVSDGQLTDSKPLAITIVQEGITESIGNDTLTGTCGNDNFNGLAGNDIIVGGAGNDTINGGAGADTMIGGTGNDTYYVDNVGDVVKEHSAKDGYHHDKEDDHHYDKDEDHHDRDGDYQCTQDHDNGTQHYGKDGVDTVHSYTLSLAGYTQKTDNFFVINSSSSGMDNYLTGDSASSVLDGRGGVDHACDTIAKSAHNGLDTVISSINYALTANVENLILTGTIAINGTGNELDNQLTGNDVNNNLRGGDGNDTLTGGNGADTLIGGHGQDDYSLAETTAATDTLQIAKGDSLITGYDKAFSFALGTGIISTAGVDQLDLANTNIAANTAAVNGDNSGIIHSHSISNGIISFDDVNSYHDPLAITDVNLADVFSYLQANITGGNTVAFVAEGNTFVFQDGGAVDTLVELVGVTAHSVNTTGLASEGVWLV